MSIIDPLVLPVDVAITPVAGLAAGLRTRLKARDGEYAVTRPRGRSPAKLVSAEGARLLEEFRGAKRVADAILAYAARHGLDPDALLVDAYPLLRDCFDHRFLVPASSPEAARILPTRERGDRIGRFEVLRCLRVLEDTELYQARDGRGILAAVKLSRPGVSRATGLMLAREAAVLRHLGGAGVPRLLARGRHERQPWLAESWCAGVAPQVAFGELRERDTPEARRRLLDLMIGAARAYARLHRRGILHGDVNPNNLLVGRREEVVLLDFGLSIAVPPRRLAGRPARGGVAAFFAPEGARALLAGRSLPVPCAASEQYALGALLYFLITGQPYTNFDLERETVLRQVVTDPPLPFSQQGTAPWPEMEDILARTLRKDPGQRYPGVTSLVHALRRVPIRSPRRAPAHRGEKVPSLLGREFLSRVHFSGADFPRGPEVTQARPTCSVKFGGAGVAYVLYRIACLRDDAETLALADAWLARTESAIGTSTAFADPGTELAPENQGPISPYHAEPGVHLVRTLVALAMGDRRSAEAAAARFVETSRMPWEILDLTLGRGGTLLGCTLLLEAMSLPPGSSAAVDRLRQLGDESLTWLWARIDRFGQVGRAPELEDFGIAHGWGGILYASLRWCRSARSELPPNLPGRVEELASCAEGLGRGVHWWPRYGENAPKVWSGREIMGWCVGPAGLIHLWTLAHAQFRRPEYLALAEASGWSAWDGPNPMADLCCGLAGRAYGLLNLYKHTGAPEWLERARVLAGRASRTIADTLGARARPLSLFKGLPGVVLLLADLERPEAACMPLFEPEGWPDPPLAPSMHV